MESAEIAVQALQLTKLFAHLETRQQSAQMTLGSQHPLRFPALKLSVTADRVSLVIDICDSNT